MQGSN